MPGSNDGIGTVVAEIGAPAELAKAFTLFQIEESLVLLAESAEDDSLPGIRNHPAVENRRLACASSNRLGLKKNLKIARWPGGVDAHRL